MRIPWSNASSILNSFVYSLWQYECSSCWEILSFTSIYVVWPGPVAFPCFIMLMIFSTFVFNILGPSSAVDSLKILLPVLDSEFVVPVCHNMKTVAHPERRKEKVVHPMNEKNPVARGGPPISHHFIMSLIMSFTQIWFAGSVVPK